MNIIAYVQKEKRTLSQLPFNEVDSLVLSQLSYLNFDRALPKIREGNSGLTLGDFHSTIKNYEQIFEHVLRPRSNKKLLAAVVASPRFQNFGVTNYVNDINRKIEKQFAALTFVLDKQTIYVAFRGTDDTVIGWKEDFNLVYISPIPAQKEAALYLEKMAAKSYTKLFVGGHSKGGTLAAYSIINAPWRVKKEVVAVYNHDGPGFKMSFWQGWRAKLMARKIKKTLPQSSIVGILLETNPRYDVVKSKRLGLMQHDPFSWQIDRDHFVLVDRISKGSQYLDKALKTWLGQLPSEKRALFVDTLFQIVSASEVEDFSQLSKISRRQIEAMVGAAKNLDQETQDFLKQTLKNLGKIYWHYLTANVKKKTFN